MSGETTAPTDTSEKGIRNGTRDKASSSHWKAFRSPGRRSPRGTQRENNERIIPHLPDPRRVLSMLIPRSGEGVGKPTPADGSGTVCLNRLCWTRAVGVPALQHGDSISRIVS